MTIKRYRNPHDRRFSQTVVYYESINREVKRRLIYEYRCDERIKTKNEESTRLRDTGFIIINR